LRADFKTSKIDAMKNLYVPDNMVNASLKIGLESGFIEKSPRGFRAEKTL
jgi:hypothetical protein